MDSTLKIDGQETFIKITYNGIEIIVRKSDGFINASMLVIYASAVGELLGKINKIIIVEHEADQTQAIVDQFHSVININTETLSNRITELNSDARSLVPNTIQNRRKMKKAISKRLMEQYKDDTLLFIDNLPIAATINEVIKELLSNGVGMKIKVTKYTFPNDQIR
ncbi:MAG: hypothetical protein EZS28_039336 [Streblomastix strix]|uniref:Uncharacterized protein n=1 Tax=Streblomastix strix TaxID=222440 RepID=A0A5J4U3G8_9EUKA|nr:MAG: hypothetical protein EZS28_039336 [Streblomastix strix]